MNEAGLYVVPKKKRRNRWLKESIDLNSTEVVPGEPRRSLFLAGRQWAGPEKNSAVASSTDTRRNRRVDCQLQE